MLQLLLRAKLWWMRVVGRRGSALLFFAFVNLVYCWSLLTITAAVRDVPAYIFIDKIAPLEAWAGIWGFVGLTCIVFAFRTWDGIAFTLAIAHYLLWGSVYLAGDLMNEIYRGYLASAIWFGFALFVGLIAGWPEAPGGDTWRTQESSSRSSP